MELKAGRRELSRGTHILRSLRNPQATQPFASGCRSGCRIGLDDSLAMPAPVGPLHPLLACRFGWLRRGLTRALRLLYALSLLMGTLIRIADGQTSLGILALVAGDSACAVRPGLALRVALSHGGRCSGWVNRGQGELLSWGEVSTCCAAVISGLGHAGHLQMVVTVACCATSDCSVGNSWRG